MREKAVEKYLKEQVEKRGGLCLKFVSPGTDGVPDRIIIMKGKVAFVETKAPNKKARALQLAIHDEFRAAGSPVYTLDSKEGIDELIEGWNFD